MTAPLVASTLPLPLLRRGKVREVYEVDSDTLLLVASDRVSAFDVVLKEPVPHKGTVLTQLSAFWFGKLAAVMPNHFLTADADALAERVPALVGQGGARHAAPLLAGRAMLVRRTTPVPFECVMRGYIAGSAWAEYRERGTLAGEPVPVRGGAQLCASERHHHRRHQIRVRYHRDGRAARDRRDPHPRLVPLLARRPLPARQEPAELRQAAVARLFGRPEEAGEVEREPAAAAAPARGGARHERALLGCVPPPDGEGVGGASVIARFVPTLKGGLGEALPLRATQGRAQASACER